MGIWQMLEEVRDDLVRTFGSVGIARLLSMLNALVLAVIGGVLLHKCSRPAERNVFVVPSAPSPSGPPEKRGALDLRWELSAVGFGLVVFAAAYLVRAMDPYRTSLRLWQILLNAMYNPLLALGLLRAVGRALDAGVRVSEPLPKVETPPEPRRWLTTASKVLLALHHRLWAQALFVALLVAELVVHLVLKDAPEEAPARWGEQVFADLMSLATMGTVTLAIGVELNRYKAEFLGLLATGGCAAYAILQVVPFGITSRHHPFYWFTVLVAFSLKFALGLGLLGLAGAARILTPEINRLAETKRIVKGVRHEIRTPITAIRESVETLKRGHHGGASSREWESLDFYAMTLGNLAEKLGQFLDDSSCSSASNETPVDLGDVLADIVRLMSPQLRAERLDPSRIDVAPSGPRIRGNQTVLGQIFFNLLQNAVRYRKSKGELRVRVAWDTTSEGTHVLFQDHGVGVLEEDKDRIFEPGVRGSYAHRSSPQGTGLGLTLCRKIMRDHGGTIRLTQLSEPTEFTLTFPSDRVVARPRAVGPEEPAA